MDITFGICGIFISLGLSILMLFSRKSIWFSNKFKWTVIIAFLVVGVFGLSFSKLNNYRFIFYSMIVVVICFTTEKFFRFLSIKIHGRDFYLYLKGSNEITQSFFPLKTNKHIRATDVIFSLVLLFEILGLSAFGAVLFGHDNLWNKF
jgi:hypothetical protein